MLACAYDCAGPCVDLENLRGVVAACSYVCLKVQKFVSLFHSLALAFATSEIFFLFAF